MKMLFLIPSSSKQRLVQASFSSSGSELRSVGADYLSRRQQYSPSESLSRLTLLQEFWNIHFSKDLEVHRGITHVMPLSGRCDYLDRWVDSEAVSDRKDDRPRINRAIYIARTVASMKLGKSLDKLTLKDCEEAGPRIVYSGRGKHIQTMTEVLERDLLDPGYKYPDSKFDLLDLPTIDGKQMLDTRGHFVRLESYSFETGSELAIVTSAFHAPRAARLIGTKGRDQGQWYSYSGKLNRVTFYLIDREFQNSGVKEDILGELNRIYNYANNGDLAKNIEDGVRHSKVWSEEVLEKIKTDKRYCANMDWGQARIGHPEGTVRAHIAELEENLRAIEQAISPEFVGMIRLLIHSHDTFKGEATKGAPIADPRSHASLARVFLSQFISDQDLLSMVQLHDEPYALWRQMESKKKYSQDRWSNLLSSIKDWDLFLTFSIVDGLTEGKDDKPLRWFVGELQGKKEISIDPTKLIELIISSKMKEG